ncbi:MAG TPA: glycosyltransferase family 4 protein [Candidatus Aquilonibacter sp.]|nr:glycosyltransferase family 4 protein [Candidatus Aquilonibacter sp.]
MPTPPPNSRIIVLTEIEAMGGAERSVLALCRWLYQRDIPNHIVTYIDHIGLAKHAQHPLEVVELRPRMRATKKIAALRRYFRTQRNTPKPLMSGYQPALHATLAGLRGFHCLMHDTPSLFEHASSLNLKRRLARRVSDSITAYGLRSGGHTIVTSEYLRAECRREFNVRADIARMGGLTSPDNFRPRPVTHELRMLSVSRIEPNKRIDWILRALEGLEHESPTLSARVDWRLDIVGKGSALEAMQQLAANLGLAGRVHFHGYLSDADLAQLYDTTHLFLMPAIQGYGIPAIEALSRGIPVLLHRESGVSDILRRTPWVEVISGRETAMLAGLRQAINRTIAGTQLDSPLPHLPTEDEWAARVARLCDWL